MKRLTFVGLLHTTPRVGQNAVLRCLRTVCPDAAEWGDAHGVNGLLISTVPPVMPPDVWDGFDTSGARWGRPVWMRRRDQVNQAISWAIAAQTGRFLSTTEPRAEPEYRRSDVDEGLASIRDRERQLADWMTGREVLTVWYEDHVESDPAVAARMILDWWQLDGEPGDPGIRRHGAADKRRWRQLYEAGL